ncbi:serine carboxypeptidase-like 48 [Phtheirospermum japonicum]|uniref:Serine carboxypeptidase-like 48 n=1 Tax=Phtheirospermum japonicum TaxID=374723 RepID=A0A830CC93_9LAMI|nr:serine carboxypeptidase-like 48 [Phtheirospermum japonicum]
MAQTTPTVFPLLHTQKFLPYVDSSLPAPSRTISSSGDAAVVNLAYNDWLSKDQIVRVFLASTLMEEAMAVIIGCRSSADVWSTLATTFNQQSKARELRLKDELQFIKKVPKDFELGFNYCSNNVRVRSFNIRAKICVPADDPLDDDDESEIVEKPFRFPSLSSSTNVTYLGHHAGYVRLLNSTKGRARMFYYFFEARQNKKTAPVVVYITGGPGCSGSLSLFYANGPFHLTHDLSLVWNDYGWDKVASILFVDQPIGTGFSYSTKETDIPTTSEEAAVHFYDFLQVFFKKHPEYADNDFYITGGSYAGHYIPAFAAQGLVIGDGWINSGVQTASDPDYAKNMTLINQSQYNKLIPLVSECLDKVKHVCGNGTHYNRTACGQAYLDCNIIFDTIVNSKPGLNPYDIRKKCEKSNDDLCYDFSNVGRFLNQKSVKRALGVDERMEFASCSNAVQNAMLGDEMRNLAVYIPELLDDGIKLLLYVGEYDLICNWLGISQSVHEMQWSGHNGFNTTDYVPFLVDGAEAGSQKSYGNLTFLKVYDAGHAVPMDQPKPALEMLGRWMQGHIPL